MALHKAAVTGNTEAMVIVFMAGAYVNAKAGDGLTPLHVGVALGTAQNIDMRLKARADIEVRDNDSLTPLHFAPKWGHKPETIEALLKAGADSIFRTENSKTTFDFIKDNDSLKNTNAYWMLYQANVKK